MSILFKVLIGMKSDGGSHTCCSDNFWSPIMSLGLGHVKWNTSNIRNVPGTVRPAHLQRWGACCWATAESPCSSGTHQGSCWRSSWRPRRGRIVERLWRRSLGTWGRRLWRPETRGKHRDAVVGSYCWHWYMGHHNNVCHLAHRSIEKINIYTIQYKVNEYYIKWTKISSGLTSQSPFGWLRYTNTLQTIYYIQYIYVCAVSVFYLYNSVHVYICIQGWH